MGSQHPNELTSFLLSRQKQSPLAEVDWDERRQRWIHAVEQLYQLVTGDLLADAITQKLVKATVVEKKIKEEFLGTYKVPELRLKVGGEAVRFSPKGRNIIGAEGRVDLVGELDSVTLILESDEHWSVVQSRVPRQIVPLDDKTLAEALRRVMR